MWDCQGSLHIGWYNWCFPKSVVFERCCWWLALYHVLLKKKRSHKLPNIVTKIQKFCLEERVPIDCCLPGEIYFFGVCPYWLLSTRWNTFVHAMYHHFRVLIKACHPHSFKPMPGMMASSNGNIFHVTGTLCGEFTGDRWISRTKASDAELWCFLWSAPE